MTNKILVIKHGSFGDIIQINGCLRDIRENYIDNEIYILTTPAFRSYFERCPYIDKVIVDERKSRWNIFYLLKIKDVLANLKFQKIFDLQNSRRTEFYRKYLSNSIEWISSRTILNPVFERDGQKIAIAGLFTSGNFRNKNVEIAIREPVFPHDTITLAFFFCTLSIAFHILDFLPLLIV